MIEQSPPSKRHTLFQLNRSLQVNILVVFATLQIITVLVIIGYTYRQNSTAVLQLSSDLINQITETVIEKTDNYLAPAAVMAQVSAKIPNSETFSLIENEELEAYGMEVLALYPQLSGFFIGNEQGDFLFTKRFPDGSIGTQMINRSTAVTPIRTWTYRDIEGNVTDIEVTLDPPYDPRERPWYQGAKDLTAPYWTDIYIFFTDQKPGITAAYPIVDDAGHLHSVIGIDVALDELSQFLQTQTIGQTGVAFIVNDKAEIVAYPNVALATAEGESFRPIALSELGHDWVTDAYQRYDQTGNGRFTIRSNNTSYIASFTPFPTNFGKDWTIGILVPEDDFIGRIKTTNQISLLISFIILIVAVVMILFFSRSISRPIEQLTAETEKIKEFKLDNTLAITSPIHEVQRLAESISAMKKGLEAFKKYVPAALVRQLIQTGEEAQLGGYQKELTIFFTDIAGFTTITEDMPPQALMLQLSDYLGELATIVMEQKGTVDKYVGDGLMAFWGAPLPMENHAYYACRAGLLCREKSAELNQKWRQMGKLTFLTRIGIHTGKTLVGNMGSENRMNYTVLGDSVNLASRLEPINDVYGTEIIVSNATYEKVSTQFHFRPLDVVTVKGKREYILLYELMGEKGQTPDHIIALCQGFEKGFNAYLTQNWPTALAIFEALHTQYPHDTATEIYLTRCIALHKDPPGPDWKPIVHLATAHKATQMEP